MPCARCISRGDDARAQAGDVRRGGVAADERERGRANSDTFEKASSEGSPLLMVVVEFRRPMEGEFLTGVARARGGRAK